MGEFSLKIARFCPKNSALLHFINIKNSALYISLPALSLNFSKYGGQLDKLPGDQVGEGVMGAHQHTALLKLAEHFALILKVFL